MPSSTWRTANRVARTNVNLTRANQHGLDLKGLYLGLLLRALTGGLEAPGQSEPLVHPSTGLRVNVIRKFKNDTAPLIWDGHQRGIETGRVLESVLDAQVPGAVVEVGVFRGGLSAYMQGILLARHSQEERQRGGPVELRKFWLVDSFQGLPDAAGMKSRNAGDGKFNSAFAQAHWSRDLEVGENTVYSTFERYRLLEKGNVHALRGFVNETLPNWPKSRKIALLRIDVDLYSATYDTLHYLYPRLSPGGAVLFDDWKFSYVREAINDYRRAHNVNEPIRMLRDTYDPMAYWIHCPKGFSGGMCRSRARL